MSDDTPVGIIGLGLLGSALAERLLKGGFRVVGFDVEPSRRELLVKSGGEAVDSAQSVASQARRIVFSLPNSDVVQQVLDEISPTLAPGSIVIDTTTGDPETMTAFGRKLQSLGVHYLDATVGGSSQQARDGDVTIMAGGGEAEFAACRDLFATLGRQTFHVGPCGHGARMKLAVNLVLGLNRVALAEGLSFARALGLDLHKSLEIFRAGPAWSRAMDIKGIKMIEQDFEPQAKLSQHLKDVKLILANGRDVGCNPSVFRIASQPARTGRASWLGRCRQQRDHSGISVSVQRHSTADVQHGSTV